MKGDVNRIQLYLPKQKKQNKKRIEETKKLEEKRGGGKRKVEGDSKLLYFLIFYKI